MNPFVLGFLTKCAQLGLNQDQAVALLLKAAAEDVPAAGTQPAGTIANQPGGVSTGGSLFPNNMNNPIGPSPMGKNPIGPSPLASPMASATKPAMGSAMSKAGPM